MWSVTVRKLDCYMEGRFADCAWPASSSLSPNNHPEGGGCNGGDSGGEREAPVNPYQMLQVRKDATQSEIRLCYRRLALWHHPGRVHETGAERQRRFRIFEILAACCETLLERPSRERCDVLLKEWELRQQELARNFLPGDVRVGGKSILANARSFNQSISTCSAIPDLSRSLSGSSSDEEDYDGVGTSALLECGGGLEPPDESTTPTPTTNKKSSRSKASSEDERDIHYTHKDTNRLFGGALSILYKARNFQPFADPFTFFAHIFGSEVFPRPPKLILQGAGGGDGASNNNNNNKFPQSAAWIGSSDVSKNGTAVYRTSRILHNRKLTKTETITVDPKTGKKRSHISVSSEELTENPEEETVSFEYLFCCTSSTFLISCDEIGTTTDAFWEGILAPCGNSWNLV